MKSTVSELDQYKKFIEGKTSSKNVLGMYVGRVKKFLELYPEAMGLDESATRELIDNYIKDAPTNSAKEVLATAVRYYWSYRFGKPYFEKYSQRDFPPNDTIDNELAEFKIYLVTTKLLTDETIKSRVATIRRFLYTTFREALFLREAVTVDVVRDYLAYMTPQLSLSVKSYTATDIRSYAVFLAESGQESTALAISNLPLSFNNKRSTALPGRIEDIDLQTLIDSIDPSSERGARDLALVLLLGNLGLRLSDAVCLSLDDINWAAGELAVRNSKSKTPRRLPLDAECGSALERYVSEYRPKTAQTRRLFLIAGREAGDGPLNRAQAKQAVKLAAEKAGIGSYAGTHTLRRAAATNMVEAGVDIKTVADILGHERIVTAAGYVRLDLSSLRKVAAEWPGDEVCHG